MRKNFSFIYPVTHRKADPHRKCGLQYEHVADLMVRGVASRKDHRALDNIQAQYDFEIKEVLYNGINVLPLISAIHPLDNIKDACLNYMDDLFIDAADSGYQEAVQMNPSLAKVISLPLRRRMVN